MRVVEVALRELAGRYEARLRRRLPQCVAGLIVVGLVAANPPTAGAADRSARRAAASTSLVRSLQPASVFLGSRLPGLAGVEASARALLAATGGLQVEPGQFGPWVRSSGALVRPDRCPPSELAVSWVPPVGEHEVGAYISPLGPPPTAATLRVNGVVVCRTSDFAFLGFEAAWDGGRWRLAAVPSLADETGEPLLEGEAEADGATPAESTADGAGAATLPPASEWAGSPLEPLAAYLPQTTCDPSAKPGVLGFRDLLLASYPGSRNLGIGRACEAEGVSEHKEGRAFDWGVSADDPTELAAAEAVLTWMLGSDESGEPFAIARRLGLMYVIWDGRIWSAFLATEGWRPYVGVSGHRDHIHFSFDWPGAQATTSFWQGGRARAKAGSDVPDLPLMVVSPKPGALPAGLPPAGALFPPSPLPPGAHVPPPSPREATSDAAEPVTPDHRSPAPSSSGDSTTTTTSPSTTTTTTAPPTTTTTTTTPEVTVPPSPPTTFGLGGL